MRQRERQDNRPASMGDGDAGDSLDQLREQAHSFLSAGDDAINRALANSDSETFMRATRQQGGE